MVSNDKPGMRARTDLRDAGDVQTKTTASPLTRWRSTLAAHKKEAADGDLRGGSSALESAPTDQTRAIAASSLGSETSEACTILDNDVSLSKRGLFG